MSQLSFRKLNTSTSGVTIWTVQGKKKKKKEKRNSIKKFQVGKLSSNLVSEIIKTSFMTKSLFMEIMTKSRLRENCSKNKTEENRLLYFQQRNKCVSLFRKTKINYNRNLDKKNITDSKIFWETVKPLLPDESMNSDKIYLNEND